jgi:chemotaxis protein CheX
MFVLTERRSIHSAIYSEGMDKIIRPITSLQKLDRDSKKITPKLDVNFLNPFIEGTIYVLNVQGNIEVKPLKPTLKSTLKDSYKTDIAGIIGLTSQSFHGNIAICFPKDLFLFIIGKMLGEEFTEITDDLKDGAAEITNMILGYAKKILNENGHTIEKALPSVICATDLKITNSSSQDSIILPFNALDMYFYIEISIENRS